MSVEWKSLGDTDRASFRAALRGSPLASEDDAIYDAARGFTRLLVAQAIIESDLGRSLLARDARNFLGQRPRPGDTKDVIYAASGPFKRFASFAGCASYYVGKLTDPGYAYARTTTLEEFVHTYAPASDDNDEDEYVSSVLRYTAQLPKIGDTPVPGSVVGIPVVRMLLSASASNRPGRALPTAGQLFIVVHETGNTNAGADAASQIRYLQSAEARSRSVSYHLSVDDHQIVQGLPLDEIGWHAGDGCDNPAVDVGCFRSVAIETCVNRDGDKAKTRRNLAECIARIAAGDPAFEWGGGSSRGRFDIDHLMQHNWVSDEGKNCPMQIRNEGFWPTLMAWVDEAWATWKPGAGPPPPPPPPVDDTYPNGMDRDLAELWFGPKFNPAGAVSKWWLAHGKETGRWPKLAKEETFGERTYFRFADGTIVWRPNPDAPLAVLQ